MQGPSGIQLQLVSLSFLMSLILGLPKLRREETFKFQIIALGAVVAPEIFVNGVIQKFKDKFFIGGLMRSNIFLLWV